MRALICGSASATFISTPRRRMGPRCCARAASGHAATAPPISVMNSRRFMPVPKLGRRYRIGSRGHFDRG